MSSVVCSLVMTPVIRCRRALPGVETRQLQLWNVHGLKEWLITVLSRVAESEIKGW